MEHSAFVAAYRRAIAGAVSMLKPNRFAVFVVGDFRDENGFLRSFVSDTIDAFQSAGAKLYNDAVLVTAAGSLPLRTARQFSVARKLGRTHQNVLVFFKGDTAEVKKWPLPDFGDNADSLLELPPGSNPGVLTEEKEPGNEPASEAVQG